MSISMSHQIIILAAGNGSRMNSELPKVMHEVGDKSMLERVVANTKVVTNDLILVHSPKLLEFIDSYKDLCKFALQPEPNGTADAVYCALDLIDENKTNLVIYADNPFISSEIILELLNHLESSKSSIITLSFKRDDPGQYGRIVTDEIGNFIKIVEFKNASDEEKKITHCNSGIMAFAPSILKKYLPLMINSSVNQDSEIYLTKIVETAKNLGERVSYLLSDNQDVIVGVNTKDELLDANKILQQQNLSK
jgi:UDP-N-acetylglucosamine pyrophosphorylase